MLIWVEFWFGGTQIGYTSDVGVRRGVKFWYGGMQVPKGWEPLPYTFMFSINHDLNKLLLLLTLLNCAFNKTFQNNDLQSSKVEEHWDTEGEEVDDWKGLEHENSWKKVKKKSSTTSLGRNQTDVVASTLCDRFGPDYIWKQ